MRLRRAVTATILLLTVAVQIQAEQPLVGTWRLDRQEMNGEKINFEPLTLKIVRSGDKLAFSFSVPVNKIYFVSMSYTLRLDGSDADVLNAQGEKAGTIQMTSAGSLQYKLIIRGPNRPRSSGKLMVSPDGKTLTAESETAEPGRTAHVVQLFTRQ